MAKPDFIIIGETKCGTTSLYNYLIKHPKVLETFGNGINYNSDYQSKEIRFFDRYYDMGWEWYYSRFPETKQGEVTGEATPMYLYRTIIAARMRARLPKIKLLVMLRNPVDRLLSNYFHNYNWFPGWKEAYPTIENYINSCSDRDYYLIEKGLYYYSISKWLNYFPINQFYFVNSDEMFAYPDQVYSKVIDFLGIESYNLESYETYRLGKHLPVDQKLLKNLQNFYRPYNRMLFNLLNKDFEWYV